jgi:probable phosphoglycerate mutase
VIFLIRHGETVGNASRIVQRPEEPLSPRGVAQAERLARRLAHDGLARIVSSDLARAATTAQVIQRVTGVPLMFEPLLHERNFGDLRGTPYAALGFDMFEPDYARRTARRGRCFTRASIERGNACGRWSRRPMATWPS